MVTTYTANYAIGDTVYYVVLSTVKIYACTVEDIYLRNSSIYYDLVRTDNGQGIKGVDQTEVLTFASARTSLLTYLNTKLIEVTNSSA